MSSGIVFYQVVIFSIILVAARFGTPALNRVTLAVVVFTFVNIFKPWLMVLQFGTIFVAYRLAKYVVNEGTGDEDTSDNQGVADEKSDLLSGTVGERTSKDYDELCGNALEHGVAEDKTDGDYLVPGDSTNDRKNSREEDAMKSFESFREASLYAKNNPGLKVVRDGNGKYLVKK